MTSTESDGIEARVMRIERSLREVERRLAAIESVPSIESGTPPVEESPPPPLLDFALIGRSVLIVGGAYLLRALSESGLLPQRAGALLAFAYAMAWIALADRALHRGRRTVALYDASTAAAIGGALIWEATTRFHVFGPAAGSALVAIAALALFAVAVRRESNALVWIAAAMTTFTLVGLAIGTADVLPPAIAATVIGVVAVRRSPTLAIVSDFFALALIAMAALGHSRPHAELVLVLIAGLWVVVIESSPRWPQSIQTAAALLIGAGGASLLACDALTLAVLWSAMSLATAWIGRRLKRNQWTLQAPLWAIAATVAAFVAGVLPIVAAFAVLALALLPVDALRSRLTLLAIITLALLAAANSLLHATDGALAMQRSILLAFTAVVLSFLGRMLPEASILARIVLAFGALKFLVEDFPRGRATTIALALAAYGTALLLIARRRPLQSITRETV